MLCGVDDDCFRFYDEVLGLKRTGDFDLPHDEIGTSGKDIFQLSSEEGFHMLRFDDPRSGDGIDKRSGRLIIFNFKPDSEMVDVRSQTLLGNLGHTAYTWKVNRIHEFREKAAHLCLETGDIHLNEFGENSFTAVSPDGCQWVFISAQGGEGASE
jgi:catechol 2,3-dioxygenase-like lactoylglutathione lyase family enzyme